MKLPKGFLLNPVNFLAFGFGSGCAPKAPGTWGTVMAVVLYLPLQKLVFIDYVTFLVFTFCIGIWLCGNASKSLGVHDFGGIVWDEFVGYWLTMLVAPPGWVWILIGFLSFRLFDIWKPWPVSWVDAKVHGGVGIMLDDIVAGVFAWGVMQSLALLVL